MSCGLDRARGHLAAAAAELEAACRAWGVWADEVRERAEQRLGSEPCDPLVCSDPEYARALDAGGPFIEAARVAATALERAGCEMPAGLPGCGSSPETAIGSPHS